MTGQCPAPHAAGRLSLHPPAAGRQGRQPPAAGRLSLHPPAAAEAKRILRPYIRASGCFATQKLQTVPHNLLRPEPHRLCCSHLLFHGRHERVVKALLKGELAPKATEGLAGPTATCCRQAEPAPTCCRRIEHEIGDHKLKSPISPWFRPHRLRCRHLLFQERYGRVVKALLKGELAPKATEGSAGPTATYCCAFYRRIREA